MKMSWSNAFFSGSFLLFLYHFLPPADAFSSQTFIGKYFTSYELRKVKVKDWLGCVNHCFEEPLCISYNFHESSNTCGLNVHGLEDFIYPDSELINDASWVFHQIRPVTTTTNKVSMVTPCLCNCDSSHQCYRHPGYGEVPEKPAPSCAEIQRQRADELPDGSYYLKTSDNVAPRKVYCQMTPILECDPSKGGWTLVMKINGSKNTFNYAAQYWKTEPPSSIADFATYQAEHGADMTEKETKLKTFQDVNFNDMCLGMKTPGRPDIKWVRITAKRSSVQMYPIFQGILDPKFELPEKNKWEELIKDSSLDTVYKEGFNQNINGLKARIGILGSKSLIGFGTSGPGDMRNISCGYVNTETKKVIPAFGYVLVR